MDPGELLDFVTKALDRIGVRHFVTGSTATIAYGEPRFTNDIDIVVKLGASDLDAFIQELDGDDFYLSPEAMALAIGQHSSFNLIHPSSGLKVDFMVAEDSEFNRSRFGRVRPIETGTSGTVPFASPEDVILKKLEYFREGGSQKHLRDIVGVLRTSHDLDLSYLEEWVRRLGLAEEWQRARAFDP